MKKILITGVGGFLGSHLMNCLTKSGNWNIHGVVEHKRHPKMEMGVKEMSHDSIHTCDLRNFDEIRSVFGCVKPNIVIHLAAILPSSTAKNTLYYKVNARGTYNLLRAAEEVGIESFIFSSSINVYGPSKYLPIDENHPREPESVYGITKLTGEMFCQTRLEKCGTKVAILRFPGIFGPRRNNGIIFHWIKQALSGEVIHIPSDGSDTIETLYIDDAIHAIELTIKFLSKKSRHSEIFNIPGTRVGVLKIVENIIELAHSRSQVIIENRREPIQLYLDGSKAKKELGFISSDLQESLGEFISYLR